MKEKKPKKENKYIKIIKDLSKSKRGRAILFFVFYFIFFVILISFIRSGYQTSTNNSKDENNQNIEYKLDKIIEGNYHFTREENINGEITKFAGDKANNKISGLMTKGTFFANYFIYDNINLIKTTDKYEVVDDLYHFNDITDDKNISKFLNKATLISKQEYETGTTTYNYQITSNTIDQIINNTNIDIADIPNIITLETNEQNEVIKISYDLSSYATYLNQLNTNLTITIEYSNFNEIEDIEINES